MINISNSKLEWLREGYKIFAKEGYKGLKIELISKNIKKNKSSFYHYFATLEIFIYELLEYHKYKAKIVIQKEKECNNIIPEFLNVILEFKEDILFNKQLQINRHIPEFRKCFEDINKDIYSSIINIWMKELGLKTDSKVSSLILKLIMENFYLQITEDNFDYKWLKEYINEFKFIIQELKK